MDPAPLKKHSSWRDRLLLGYHRVNNSSSLQPWRLQGGCQNLCSPYRKVKIADQYLWKRIYANSSSAFLSFSERVDSPVGSRFYLKKSIPYGLCAEVPAIPTY